METLGVQREAPVCISVDNGTDLISEALDERSCEHNAAQLQPTDNACIESFNGRFRAERLNA